MDTIRYQTPPTGWMSKIKDLSISLEPYDSMQSFLKTCKNRTLQWSAWKHDDVFEEGYKVWGEDSQEWKGFKSSSDLTERLTIGIDDKDVLKGVKAYTGKVRRSDLPTKKRIKSVVGSSVIVPRYLTGRPNCMRRRIKLKGQSKVINIGLDISAPCSVTPKEFQDVGKMIINTIASLEKTGYRINLRVGNVAGAKERGTLKLAGFSILAKSSGAQTNYKKLAFLATDIAILRGLSFGWMVRNEDMPHHEHLGYCLNVIDGAVGKEVCDGIYSHLFGKDAIVFNYAKLVETMNEHGKGECMARIQSTIEDGIQ